MIVLTFILYKISFHNISFSLFVPFYFVFLCLTLFLDFFFDFYVFVIIIFNLFISKFEI